MDHADLLQPNQRGPESNCAKMKSKHNKGAQADSAVAASLSSALAFPRKYIMADYKTLPERTQIRLEKIKSDVVSVVPEEVRSWKFDTRELVVGEALPSIIDEVKNWYKRGCLYLYILQIADDFHDPSKFLDMYCQAKNDAIGGRAYARPNKKSSPYLYVGSSEKPYQRLKEHLGFGAKGTYAIQLAYWANSTECSILFECARYPIGISQEALQALEDTLWSDLMPMLGRQRAR